MAIGASLLLTSTFAAGQAVVLVAILGQGQRTDAFFAAYSVYLPLALWAASLRASVVPLVLLPADCSDDLRREHASAVVSRVIGIGAAASVALLAASPLLAASLGHGMSDDGRALLLECTGVLVAAGFLHFVAAALAAVLSAMQRFVFSAFVAAAGSAIALGASVVLVLWLGAVGAALGLLIGAACIAGAHLAYTRRLGVRTRVSVAAVVRREWALIVKVLAGGALLVAQQAQLAITVYSLSPTRGAITSFTYAFVLTNLLVSTTLSPLSMALMPALVREAAVSGVAAARAQLARVIPIAFDVMLPALVALVAFADPLVPWLLGGLLNETGVDDLVTMIRILGAVAIPVAYFLVSGNALHGLQLWNRVLWVSLATVVTHAAVVVPLEGQSAATVTTGHAVAVAVVAALLVRATMGPRPLGPVWTSLRRSAPAAGLALLIVGARLLVGRDPDVPVAAGAMIAGLLAYAALTIALRPQLRTRFGSLVGR